MKPRAAKRLAWFLWGLTTALVAAMSWLYVLAHGASFEGRDRVPLEFLPVVALMPLALASVGGLVATRLPSNPIGWILASAGVLGALGFAAQAYADWAVVAEEGSVRGGPAAVWLSTWSIAPFLTASTFFGLLFPSGTLPSRRWRPAAWLAGAGGLVVTAALALDPGEMDGIGYPGVRNPVGVEGADRLLEAGITAGAALALLALLLAAAAMLRRLSRSRGVEREQVKWVVYAGSLSAAGFAAGFPLSDSGPLADAVFVVAFLAFVGVPVAAGIAILRYRLYDIDVVINRTLVYGALTAVLAATYVGFVLLFQLLLEPLTQGNELAVAVSTLAVAALFRPAGSRIQHAVDRRFYRRKYDAERTLAAFSARLREEVELETLAADLRAVVRETVEPAHVSLWLREETR